MATTESSKNEMRPWEKVGMTEKQFRAVQYQAKLELCRRDFWIFCKTLAPDFYIDGRDYLERICKEFQDFYESDDKVLIVNEPPRHGKSRTASLFAQWVFGKNPSEKIITGSYNEQLSTTFSRGVRNAIMERKASKDRIVYSDIFPQTVLKKVTLLPTFGHWKGSTLVTLPLRPVVLSLVLVQLS